MELNEIIIEIFGTIPIALVLWAWLRDTSKNALFWREKYVALAERLIRQSAPGEGEEENK